MRSLSILYLGDFYVAAANRIPEYPCFGGLSYWSSQIIFAVNFTSMRVHLLCLTALLLSRTVISQNVGIGTSTPHASAQLEISSVNKGFLMPRLSTAGRNAISGPARGLMILNTDDNCTDLFDGSAWIKLCGLKQTGNATMYDNNWRQKSSVPATSYGRASAFSIGTKGYIITEYGTLFEYDQATDTWTQKASFPPGIRYRAVAFSIGTKGYFGTGTAGDPLRDDFWEYDPATNQWSQKANFPGGLRKYAVGFSIGAKGYIGTGEDNSSLKNDLWEYDPVFNTWTQKAAMPADARSWAIGFAIDGKGYVGGGYTAAATSGTQDFWEYNPATNNWTQRAFIGAAIRSMAVAFAIGSKGFVGTGTGFTYLNDFLEYNPASNTWTQKASFPPGGRFRAVGFSIGNMGYIGCGDVLTAFYNDFWEYNTTPVTVNAYSSSAAPVAAVVSDGVWTRSGSQIYNTLGGNVGIGTQLPSAKLHIAGNLRIEDGSQGVNKVLYSDVNGQAGWQLPPWIMSGNNMFNTNLGNIGIGTSTPGFPLNFANSTGDKISLWGASGAHFGFGIQNALLQVHTDAASANIAFGYGSSTSFTERARIVNSGEYGLQLTGRIQLRTGTSSPGLWLNNAANSGSPAFIGLVNDNLVGFFGNSPAGWGLTMHTSNGNVGIGLNGSNPSRPLSFPAVLGEKILLYPGGTGEVGIGVYGNELRLHSDNPGSKVSFGTQDNAGNFTENAKAERNGPFAFSILGSLWVNGTTYASDERFKQHITGITSPLQKLLLIKGVEYEMRSEEFGKYHFQPGRQIGLLAQNVETVVPEAVSAQNGYKGVDYARLVPLLIEAIREQEQRIRALESRLAHPATR